MKKLLVAGTALLDNIISSDHPLQENVCTKVSQVLCPGGSMRNVAHNLAVLQVRSDFLAVWSNDVYSTLIRQELQDLGVGCCGPVLDFPTPVFTALTVDGQQYLFSSISPEFILTKDLPFSYACYDLVLTDNEGLLESLISQHPAIEIVAVGFIPPREYQANVQGISLNRHEFYNCVNHHNYKEVAASFPNSWLIVSLDQMGLFASFQLKEYTRNNESAAIFASGFGCGDALVCGVVAKLLEGEGFETALAFGHRLAEAVYQAPKTTIDGLWNL